jgi:hypothetical protein
MKPGRKPLPKGSRRVTLNCRIEPATAKAIAKRARAQKLSVGRVLDAAFCPATP